MYVFYLPIWLDSGGWSEVINIGGRPQNNNSWVQCAFRFFRRMWSYIPGPDSMALMVPEVKACSLFTMNSWPSDDTSLTYIASGPSQPPYFSSSFSSFMSVISTFTAKSRPSYNTSRQILPTIRVFSRISRPRYPTWSAPHWSFIDPNSWMKPNLQSYPWHPF